MAQRPNPSCQLLFLLFQWFKKILKIAKPLQFSNLTMSRQPLATVNTGGSRLPVFAAKAKQQSIEAPADLSKTAPVKRKAEDEPEAKVVAKAAPAKTTTTKTVAKPAASKPVASKPVYEYSII